MPALLGWALAAPVAFGAPPPPFHVDEAKLPFVALPGAKALWGGTQRRRLPHRGTQQLECQGRRNNGLANVAPTTGDSRIPRLTLHALGDLSVPFHMEQVQASHVAAKGKPTTWYGEPPATWAIAASRRPSRSPRSWTW